MRSAWNIRRSEERRQLRLEKLAADTLPGEEWRDVPNVPGVKASSLGRVRYRDGKARAGCWQKCSGQGRYILTIKTPEVRNFMVARLVCEAFHGSPPPGKPNVLHNDENSRNNTYLNLHWGTQKENLNYPGFLEYCRTRIGENSSRSKGRRLKAEMGE